MLLHQEISMTDRLSLIFTDFVQNLKRHGPLKTFVFYDNNKLH